MFTTLQYYYVYLLSHIDPYECSQKTGATFLKNRPKVVKDPPMNLNLIYILIQEVEPIIW